MYTENIFKKTKHHDLIKNEFCIKNNINLLRIPYTEVDKIEEILSRVIKNPSTNILSFQLINPSIYERKQVSNH